MGKMNRKVTDLSGCTGTVWARPQTICDVFGADEISNDLPAFVRKSRKLSEVGGMFFQPAPNCGSFWKWRTQLIPAG